jgi:hypothetical protein
MASTEAYQIRPNRLFYLGLLVATGLVLTGGSTRAQFLWNNTSGGPWQTTGNWTPNGTPGASDTASIALANMTGSVTMTAATAIGTLTINNSSATLDTSAQTFTVNTSLSLQAGTLITSGATTAAATWTTSAGTNWNWTAGTLSGAGTYGNGGTLTMSVATSAPNLSSALVNTGTFLWNGSAAIFPQTGASINNSGLFNIRADGTVVQNTFLTAAFTNTGTIRKSLGSGTSTIQAALTSTTGTIDVQTGTLNFAGGGTVSGSISAASGAAVNLGGLTLSGTLTGSGAGTVNINTTTIASGGATLNYTGSQLQWTNDSISGGTATIPVGATLTISTSNGHRLNTTLNNAGTVINTGTGPVQMNAGSAVTNSGLFDVQFDSGGVFLTADANARFTNTGTLRKSLGTGTTNIALNVTNDNGGTISIQTGTMTIGNGGTFPAEFRFKGASSVAITGGASANTSLNLPATVVQDNSSGTAVLTIKVMNDGTLNTSGSTQYTWTVLTGAGTNLTSLPLSAFAVAGGNVPITNGSVSFSGSNVVIQFTPVPEPTGLMLAAGLVFAGGAAIRRRFARI